MIIFAGRIQINTLPLINMIPRNANPFSRAIGRMPLEIESGFRVFRRPREIAVCRDPARLDRARA
jgi:hypothetical protein